jgi:hypothetical protein
MNKTKSCINIYEIFVNLTCINQRPPYSEHNSWLQGGSPRQIALDVVLFLLNQINILNVTAITVKYISQLNSHFFTYVRLFMKRARLFYIVKLLFDIIFTESKNMETSVIAQNIVHKFHSLIKL